MLIAPIKPTAEADGFPPSLVRRLARGGGGVRLYPPYSDTSIQTCTRWYIVRLNPAFLLTNLSFRCVLAISSACYTYLFFAARRSRKVSYRILDAIVSSTVLVFFLPRRFFSFSFCLVCICCYRCFIIIFSSANRRLSLRAHNTKNLFNQAMNQ